MYRCMVMSWSSGAKLTRRFWYFMLLRRLAAFSLEGGAMAASTVRSRFKTCNYRIVTYAVNGTLGRRWSRENSIYDRRNDALQRAR